MNFDIKIGDFFLFCNDIVAMKNFYFDCIGLSSTGYSAEKGFLSLQIDSNTFLVIMQVKEKLPIKTGWAKGPTFPQGTTYDISWTIKINGEEEFNQIIEKISKNNFEMHSDNPISFNGVKAYYIKDPMGNTVEIYHSKD